MYRLTFLADLGAQRENQPQVRKTETQSKLKKLAAQYKALSAHQWTEGNNLEDALQCEEGCENDV